MKYYLGEDNRMNIVIGLILNYVPFQSRRLKQDRSLRGRSRPLLQRCVIVSPVT